MAEKIFLTTEDSVLISAVWRNAGPPFVGAAILLHMMPATKESYDRFGEKLAAAGISSLAIDFRGHGESVRTVDGRELDYKKFSDEEHQTKINDVEAARAWLLRQGTEPAGIVLVGASIGANLALEEMASHPEIPAGIILSPGLNYRGVLAAPLVRALSRGQSVLLVASGDDPESAEAAEKLAEVSLAKTRVKIFETAGHGTAIFERQPDFMDEALRWLGSILR